MVKRLSPKGARAKMNFSKLENRFGEAFENIKSIGVVDLVQIGIDWNPSVLTSRGKGIGYEVSHYGSDNTVGGRIKNIGRNQIGIEVYSGDVGSDRFSNDEIVRCLSEAVDYAGKLRIMEGATILPPGENPEADAIIKENGGGTSEVQDISQYQAFSKDLMDMARRIHVARKDGAFGNYLVAEMDSGWIVAYSTEYKEGPYVVTNLETLFQDKSTIRENGDAIRFRRDRRGDRWMGRILDLVG